MENNVKLFYCKHLPSPNPNPSLCSTGKYRGFFAHNGTVTTNRANADEY